MGTAAIVVMVKDVGGFRGGEGEEEVEGVCGWWEKFVGLGEKNGVFLNLIFTGFGIDVL